MGPAPARSGRSWSLRTESPGGGRGDKVDRGSVRSNNYYYYYDYDYYYYDYDDDDYYY